MSIKAVIFDLDGVICRTDRYHYLAWKALADRLGIPFDEAINNRLRGVSRMASLEIILEKSPWTLPEEEKIRLAEEKNALYRTYLQQMTPADVSVDVMDTLKELRRRGLLLAIGSSSKNAGFILERIGLDKFFDAVSDGNNITHSKPDPEVFVCAARMLEMPPQDCLVVEDARVGVDAAKNAGMSAAGIGDAAGYDKADVCLSVFSDLLRFC